MPPPTRSYAHPPERMPDHPHLVNEGLNCILEVVVVREFKSVGNGSVAEYLSGGGSGVGMFKQGQTVETLHTRSRGCSCPPLQYMAMS